MVSFNNLIFRFAKGRKNQRRLLPELCPTVCVGGRWNSWGDTSSDLAFQPA